MENFFKKTPEIIREAARSTLGIISLVIISLSLLALTFFATASEYVQVGIFVLIFIGAGLFVASLSRHLGDEKEAASQASKSHKDEQIKNVKTIEEYLSGIIEEYSDLQKIYSKLPISIAPQIPSEFSPTLLDNRSFQVLIERSVGQAYHTTERVSFSSIQEVVEEFEQTILLGDPGSGKTVTLWKLAVEYATKALKNPSIQPSVPVLTELGQYDGSIGFNKWLLQQGKAISDFSERLESGSIVFLLDGLNEMPKANLSESIKDLREFVENNNASKFVVTCRTQDYDEILGLQKVEIEPLDEKHIEVFVLNYLKDRNKAQRLLKILMSDTKLVELASNALNLKLIVALYDLMGDKFPRNRSKLLHGFFGALYEREKDNSSSVNISEKKLLQVLGKLAFVIQDEVGKGTSVKKNWAVAEVVSEFPNLSIDEFLALAKNMGVLVIDQTTLRFQHQLMQEYFAATELASIEENLQKRYWIKDGWEEVTIMLSGSMDESSQFVRGIARLDPVLAARCITEGLASVDFKTQKAVIRYLIEIIEAAIVDLHDRIKAGLALGELDDPRFQRITIENKPILIPPLVQIPEGKYIIGRDKEDVSDSYLDETPRHTVRLKSFQIGKYPITNAEYECFINDQGYEKQKYWSDDGWAWRQGEIGYVQRKWLLDGYRKVRRQVLEEIERLEPGRSEDSEEMDIWWKILMEWPDDKAETELEKLFIERNFCHHDVPCYWNDPFFNRKSQPVITTWFEANAFCNWLSEILDKKIRLPTEAEWEASTGGSKHQHPWGDEPDTSKYNILPTGIMRTTPVGVFPDGISEFGLYDLLGNVWEWTSSAKAKYPYDRNDGREKPFIEDDCRRIVRGGSWAVSPQSARNSCRGNFPPDNLVRNYIGFRVVCKD